MKPSMDYYDYYYYYYYYCDEGYDDAAKQLSRDRQISFLTIMAITYAVLLSLQ